MIAPDDDDLHRIATALEQVSARLEHIAAALDLLVDQVEELTKGPPVFPPKP